YGLEGDGVKVGAAEGTEQARQLFGSELWQVALICVRDTADEALGFVRWARANEEARSLPILVMGPAQQQTWLQAAAGELLPLPPFVRDAITAAKLLAGTVPVAGSEGEGELQGALSDYGLFFLVRTMIGLRRSGILQ